MVPEICLFQVAPPSLVARMTPAIAPPPTTQPWAASLKATAVRSAPLPELCALQVAPPSVVAMIVPGEPTAQPWTASGKATARRFSLVPELCANQPLPAAEAPAGSARARLSRISVRTRSDEVRRRAAGSCVRVAVCSIWYPREVVTSGVTRVIRPRAGPRDSLCGAPRAEGM